MISMACTRGPSAKTTIPSSVPSSPEDRRTGRLGTLQVLRNHLDNFTTRDLGGQYTIPWYLKEERGQNKLKYLTEPVDDSIAIPASTYFPHTAPASTIHLLELFNGIPADLGDKGVAQVCQECRVANLHDI